MRLVIADDVGVVEQDGTVYAATLPDGPIFVLVDEAAALWRRVAAAEPVSPRGDDSVQALLAAELLVVVDEAAGEAVVGEAVVDEAVAEKED